MPKASTATATGVRLKRKEFQAALMKARHSSASSAARVTPMRVVKLSCKSRRERGWSARGLFRIGVVQDQRLQHRRLHLISVGTFAASELHGRHAYLRVRPA